MATKQTEQDYQREYRRKNKDKVNAYQREYYRRNPEKYKAYHQATYSLHKNAINKKARERRIQYKLDALNMYGGAKCACCGDAHIEFLIIDHINGHGDEERRSTGRSGNGFYLWLKKEHYPLGYRVLCQNCNAALAHWHYCPHSSPSINSSK